MQEVLITVHSIQKTMGEPPQAVEFTTEGNLYTKGATTYLVYDESELSGFPGHKTTLKIFPHTVDMRRFGENHAHIHFEKGVREDSEYETPYGVFKLETLTHRLDVNLQETSGEIIIEYALSIQGLQEAVHTLNISYRQVGSGVQKPPGT